VNNQYHFPTRWRLRAAPEGIFGLIQKPLDFPRWWGSVYLRVGLAAGEERSLGVRFLFLTKGKLPYRLRWTSETTESHPPEYLALRATGDFNGRGI
jgi:hypothetical protein